MTKPRDPLAQLRRRQPHAFHAIDPPLSWRESKRAAIPAMPAIRCCETELLEDETTRHDLGCPETIPCPDCNATAGQMCRAPSGERQFRPCAGRVWREAS